MESENFWSNYLSDIGNYVKFYNIKSDNYEDIKIPLKNEKVTNFIKKYDVSEFEFITAVFSLYLSRTDRTNGSILKTVLYGNGKSGKDILLKIPYLKNNSFLDYLNGIKEVYSLSVEHSGEDIDFEDELSYYAIHDFTEFKNSDLTEECFALALNLYEGYLDLVYNSDLFSDIYIEHMAANMEFLIDEVIDVPNQILNSIDILSDGEKDLLSDFSKGKTIDVDKDKTLACEFRDNAVKYPDMIAVDDGVNQITYADLEASSNSIAYDLIENHGISFGDCVGLMLPRTYHFPEVVLALNKIGAIFTPIDMNYPLKRIEHMLNISESNHIITTNDCASDIDFGIDVICFEDLNMNYDESVDCLGSGDDLFAILFTSGTTGLPKGVMVSNKQVKGASAAFKELFKTSVGDVVGYFASFAFIASIRMYAALIFAESCRIFNETEQKDSLLLIKTLKEQQMSDLILPPSLGIPIFENEDIKLKYLILAGAKLDELTNKQSTTKLVNFYGATEVIMAIVNIFDLDDVDESIPIGKPVSNTWAYILDDGGMQLPIGVPGEICIAGDYLSPGYYGREDLTDEVFLDNPNSTCKDNKRMYRTGDIGFYNFNGEIEIIGREDNQLSVRGFRIESGEILNIMGGFKGISDVYLDVDYDNLIAYYVADDDLNIDDVKNALKCELPYYMIPSIFIELDEIPFNANGKLDKFALNDLIRKESDADINIGDDVLNTVVDAFKEVLNCDFVLMGGNFVELGGNSLSAMKLQMLLNERLGVMLSSSEIIELATPINVSNHIRYNLNVHSQISIKYTFEDLCPLSEAQLNVYLDEKVNDMGTAYNNPFLIEFSKNYSVDEIKTAIDKLLDVHPVLSARVINDGGMLSFAFDGKPLILNGFKNDIKSFVQQFELDKSLSKFLIVENDGLNSLCVDFHHLIFDGTSANIILETLTSILEGRDVDFVDDGVLRLISFEENIAQEYSENAQKFFDLMLADRDEVHELLPSVKTGDNDDFEYVDTFNIGDELNSFLHNHSITHNQFFSSVFAYTLSRFTGSSKVLFNLIEDGRGHIDLSDCVGMFVRTLPLVIDCKNQEVSSFLDDSGSLINSVMKYDLYPFRILANQYDLNSDILFQYSHNLFNSLIDDGEVDYKVEDLKQEPMGDLSFFIFNAGQDKFGIKILYSEKFSKQFIIHFAESYKLILNEMMAVNNLSDINYISNSDIELLDSYNETESPLKYSDLLDAFNDNLEKWPENKLVSYNDVEYSYAESAFAADKIAESLKDMGVKLQDNVAFFVERSELYMLSALAIMSLGAVYVPIDDAYPDERIKFMLKDANVKAVIVSEGTYERALSLIDEDIILDVSKIVTENSGVLSYLPVVYGDLACILYTSGTTGIPKGVKITRKGITSYVDFYVNEYGMKNNSVFGLFASIGFDVGAIRGICAPLFGGSCLDIVPMDIRLDIAKLNEHFINHGVTHTTLPTQVARMFVDKVEDTSVEVLITGGEKLGQIDASVDYSFIDSYGPTECCVAVCAIPPKDKIDSSSIGYLFSNIKAYVLDNEQRRVPIGAVGELCIAGNQVADGYLNRQKETNKSFLKNPFNDDENYNVMYRTGDLVRILPDGSFGIVGRSDGQVKIRGNRVELMEVEAVILEMDYVENVAVQTVKSGTNNELVAYVVVNEEIDDETLQKRVCDYVSQYKPDYMVPSYVINLDSIPLTVNGKVDRRALPEVDRSILHSKYVAPRNEKERIVVEAFEEIFDMQKVSVHDDFIQLGGNSLTAIKLLSYLEDYDITMADILNSRTPAAIANSIDDVALDLDIYSVEGGCPLNEAQVNLFADIMINKSDFYHIPFSIHIPKHYGIEKILDALDEMLEVHPILAMHISKKHEIKDKKNIFVRLREDKDLFKELANNYQDSSLVDLLRDNGWNIKSIYDMFRIVLRLFKGEYPYLVKESKPPISVESEFNDNSSKDFFSESLDLYKYLSLFRIFELDDSYLLFAKFHHLIFDALSLNVFKHDFQLLLDGGTVEVDDAFLKTSAFAQQIKKTDKFIEADSFFDSMLSDLDEVKGLVGDKESEGFSLNTFDLEVDYAALKSFLDDAEVSESVLFTSVFAYTLSRFANGDKVLFTIVDNGRDRFNDYDSIGLYANILPLLINCENQTIDSYMKNSSDVLYNVLKYNFYSILLISKKHPIDVNVLFQYIPDWVDSEGYYDENEGLFSSDLIGGMLEDILGNLDVMVNFIVQVFKKGEDLSMMVVNSNIYSEEMIKDFTDTYNLILSGIVHKDLSCDIESIFENASNHP